MTENTTKKYIGLEEREAKAQAIRDGLQTRITGRDGEHFAVTADYREDRVNFVITAGRVTGAGIG